MTLSTILPPCPLPDLFSGGFKARSSEVGVRCEKEPWKVGGDQTDIRPRTEVVE